jgi:transcriptional regulator with XRE-family HTH domain
MNVTTAGAKTAAAMLKQARLKKGMTGSEAAQACGLSGSQYSRMENGKVIHWSHNAIVGAAVILDITINELKEILNDAPPPIWMKRQEEINDNAIHKIEEETLEIISEFWAVAKKRKAETDTHIDKRFAALSAEFKNTQDEALERIEKTLLLAVNAADDRNRQIIEMVAGEIETFRKAASYIATDMELELANLKRIVSEVRDVVQENSKHGNRLVQDLSD